MSKDNWCMKEPQLIHNFLSLLPKYVRCPYCNRRLEPKIIDHHFGISEIEDLHAWIPAHKKKGWKIKKKRESKNKSKINIR